MGEGVRLPSWHSYKRVKSKKPVGALCFALVKELLFSQGYIMHFLIYETEFVLFLAMLENSAMPMDWDSSYATLTVTSELLIQK